MYLRDTAGGHEPLRKVLQEGNMRHRRELGAEWGHKDE